MATRSDKSYDGVFTFYLSRINSAPNYGWKQGDQINRMVFSCALNDTFLTDSEFAIILNKCWDQHKHFMEEMRNEGWK